MYVVVHLVILSYSTGLVILDERYIVPEAMNVDALPGQLINILGTPVYIENWQSRALNQLD